MAPRYAGGQACTECHAKIHSTVIGTDHAQAFAALKQIGQDTNPDCLPCHTVGYGLPTGFVSESATPQLAGVQCESCHGPSARHMASEFNPRTRPLVDTAGNFCGACHTTNSVTASMPPQLAALHQPVHNDWSLSEHASLDITTNFTSASQINSCDRCHSGSARISLVTNRSLPVRTNAWVAIGCPVCHDPHAEHVWTNVLAGIIYTNQLRNPLSSTNNYFLTTTDTFKKKYDPNINICGQCHNHRGASYLTSDRPPHHSPQYNILLGDFNDLNTGLPHYEPGTHALAITNQCTDCHMQVTASGGILSAVPRHTFTVDSLEICKRCHGSFPDVLLKVVQGAITNQIEQVKFDLDFWASTWAATNSATSSLWVKYKTLTWEYTNPGELSPPGSVGPNATEQKRIPDLIKKARFNLYLVLHDGSLGVHNPNYIAGLLDDAENYIEQQLNE